MRILILFLSLLVSSCNTSVSAPEIIPEQVTLNKNNTLVLNGEINGISIQSVELQAEKLNRVLSKGQPLYLIIESPGGAVTSGLQLITYLKSLGRPVHSITRNAYSMGFFIVQGLGTRYIVSNGIMMQHPATVRLEGEVGGNLDSLLKMIKSNIDYMHRMTIARTNGRYTLDTFKALIDNEYWCHGLECVKDGFSDKIVTAKCDETLQGVDEKGTPACPLI